MNELWKTLSDPRVSITAILVGLLAAGFTSIALGYRAAAATLVVALQTPYAVSGGIIGLALVGTALALLSVHIDRVEAATERRALAGLQAEALSLLRESAATKRAH